MSIHKEIYKLQQDKLSRKKLHLQFLQKEILYKTIEESLQSPSCQNDIKQFQKTLENTVCSTLPNAIARVKGVIVP